MLYIFLPRELPSMAVIFQRQGDWVTRAVFWFSGPQQLWSILLLIPPSPEYRRSGRTVQEC